MANENEKNLESKIDEKDLDLFKDLLEDDDDDSELTNEQKTQKEEERKKNKDAEEARKRREADAKAKAEEEAKAKAKAEEEAKAKVKAEEEAKAKAEAEKNKTKTDPKNDKQAVDANKKLGEELVEFKKKHSEIDLVELDKDAKFKKYIRGKLLGKQNFTQLYEEYIELRSEFSGKSQEELRKEYERKAEASSGSSKSSGSDIPTDVYTEQELKDIARKMPFMKQKDMDKIDEKIKRSVAFHSKK